MLAKKVISSRLIKIFIYGHDGDHTIIWCTLMNAIIPLVDVVAPQVDLLFQWKDIMFGI